MEPSGSPFLALAAVGILAAVLLSFLLLRLLKSAWAVQPDARSGARLKMVYWSFLMMAAPLLLLELAVAMVPANIGEGFAISLLAFVAFCLFIAIPAALINSFWVWRHTPVRILWILVVLPLAAISTFPYPSADRWKAIVILAYALSTIILAIRGLVALRHTGPR
jgi:hypothetical protein